MNYLKKKLKSHKRGHEDPEDFDDYIPVAPPHPSEILRKQQEEEALKNATPEQLQAIEDKKKKEEERKKEQEESRKKSEGWQFFEQLSAKVSDTVTKSQAVVEKIKDSTLADDLTKQAERDLGFNVDPESDEEDPDERGASFAKGQWVGFDESAQGKATSDQPARKDSLFGDVPPISALSAANVLDDFFGTDAVEAEPTDDDPFDTRYVDVSLVEKKAAEEVLLQKQLIDEEVARKTTEAKEEENRIRTLLDSKLEPLPELEPLSEPEEDEGVHNEEFTELARSRRASEVSGANLVNPDNLDFAALAKLDEQVDITEMDEDDQPQEAGAAAADLELEEIGPDCDEKIVSIYRHGAKVLSRFGSNTSLASILSNPFLNEGDVDLYASGAASGATTPNRRNSMNPFEDSPRDENGGGITADAIASLTADFCKAVSDEPAVEEPKVEEEVNAPAKPKPPRPPPAAVAPPEKPSPPVLPPAPVAEKVVPAKPPPPVVAAPPQRPTPPPTLPTPASPTVTRPDNSTPNSDDDDEVASSVAPPAPIPVEQATDSEPFDPFATIRDDHSDHSGSNRPSYSNDAAFTANSTSQLEAPHIPDYPSDVSDTEEAGESAFEHQILDEVPDEGRQRRRSSAFQRESIPEPVQEEDEEDEAKKESPTNPSNPADTAESWSEDTSKPYFDPFQQVVEPLSPTTPERSEALDIAYQTHEDEHTPEPDAIEAIKEAPSGIVNEAFEDHTPDDEAPQDEYLPPDHAEETEELEVEEIETFPATVMSEAPVETASADTVAVIEATDNDGSHEQFEGTGASDSGLGIGGFDDTDPGRDPFDTSDFAFENAADSVPVTDGSTFDAFSSRFDSQASALKDQDKGFDAFSSPAHVASGGAAAADDTSSGFDSFDPFCTDHIRPPKNTPIHGRLKKDASGDSFDDYDQPEDFKIVIKAKVRDGTEEKKKSTLPIAPLLPPPPKTPTKGMREAEVYTSRGEFEEFDSMLSAKRAAMAEPPKPVEPPPMEEYPTPALGGSAANKRTESMESPSTPLFDDDISQPLEEFPAKYTGEGWEMYIRHPPKKKLTANRFWKKIFVKVSENSVIQLFNKPEDNDPFQELPLQSSYSLSEVSGQQYDQYGKIFTAKVQYIFYRERVGVRKGQIAKVISGQIQSVGQIKSLGMPLEHAPQISELLKLGTLVYDDMKAFNQVVDEALFRLSLHRDRALTYKTEEIQMTMQDEIYVEQNKMGTMTKQLARVRLFFIAFINGMPGVEVGVNDLTRQGKEVVGRHDILPVVTEEWIRIEDFEFHSSVMQEEFDKTRIIKLIPPDACYFELMRFRVRPPKNRELPLQVSANLTITKTNVELRCEILVPGCISRKHGQIPCEDITIRIHIPECWIYFFRTEKHLRYGSSKSANRRMGKIKGLERFLGATSNIEPTMLETSAGGAKYEHVFHSLVWRIPRLPKEGQGAYTQQTLLLRLPLTSFDQVPESFYEFVHVEFTMPSTTVSHAVVRSISVSSEEPPEKYVRYVAKYEYKIGMSVYQNYDETPAPAVADYTAAVDVAPAAKPQKTVAQAVLEAAAAQDAADDKDDSDSE